MRFGRPFRTSAASLRLGACRRDDVRSAHVALAVAFIALGAVDGVWVSRLPALKHRLDLDSGELGLVIFAVTLTAAIVASVRGLARVAPREPRADRARSADRVAPASRWPRSRRRSPCSFRRPASSAPESGSLDVSANAHGVAVEHRLGRPVLSALHGAWSFGLLGGSAIAAIAAAAGYGPRVMLPASSRPRRSLSRSFVDAEVAAGLGGRGGRHRAVRAAARRARAAGVPVFCCMFVESATMNWAAVFLAGPAHTSAAVAAARVVAFAIAMACRAPRRRPLRRALGRRRACAGRRAPHGRRNAARRSCTRSPVPALVGFACVGAGCAAIVPALFRVAACAPGHLVGRRDRGRRDCRLHRRRAQRPVDRLPRAGRGAEHRSSGSSQWQGSLIARWARACSGRLASCRSEPEGRCRRPGRDGRGIAQLCVEAGFDTVGREVTLELGEKGARPDRALPDAQGREGSARRRPRAMPPSAGSR